MNYLYWLLGISVLFVVLERLRPQRPSQPARRPQLVNDLFYLVFNGYFYSVLTAGLLTWFAVRTESFVGGLGLLPESRLLDQAPLWVAGLTYLIISDFLQWSVHVCLHKIPFLWKFHQVHHSVVQMDWAGSFRFHWVEVVVYRSVLYVPLTLLLGGQPEALFPVYVFGTLWGHFNHSNLNVGLGPLAYVMNSPRMHLWHHDASTEGGVGKNYGIVLSIWDFLFRTAYWPRDRVPKALGYPGVENMPRDLPRQLLWPLIQAPMNKP